MGEQLTLPGLVVNEPLPEQVQRYLRTVYGNPGDGDRADWAWRTARLLLAGWEPTEPLPRATRSVAASRLEGMRRAVAAAASTDRAPRPSTQEES